MPRAHAAQEGRLRTVRPLGHRTFCDHGSVVVTVEVRHPVEGRDEHPLEYRAREVGPDAAVYAEPEAVMPIGFTVQHQSVEFGEDRGVSVCHRPGQPEPLTFVEPPTDDFAVGGDGAAVTAHLRVNFLSSMLGIGVRTGLTLSDSCAARAAQATTRMMSPTAQGTGVLAMLVVPDY